MKYQVEIIERHRGVFEIEAESEDEAMDKAVETCRPEFEATESIKVLSSKE